MTERGRRATWSDDRLDAAFAARFDPIHVPHGAVAATLDRLREPAVGGRWSRTRWRLGAVAAAVILVAGAIGLGSSSLRMTDSQVGGLFRDGPDPNLRTLDVGSFAFEFPATWLAYEAGATFSGGSSIAFLGTQAVEARCGDERHVDPNCVYEQRLEPGDVRVFVGTGGYRDGTILDRPDIENGTTERLVIAGRPAIRDTFDPEPASYYREDLAVHWAIAYPDTLTNVVRFELWAREDPSAGEPVIPATLQAMEALLGSFRYQNAAASPGQSDAVPTTVLGLPVISVREALRIRDGGVDDRELAVRGWFPPIPPIRCRGSATSSTSPIEPVCSDEFTVLMQEPESLTTVSATGAEVHGPAGPSLPLALDQLDRSWEPPLPDAGPVAPIELVLVGHFDDGRSSLCPGSVEQACRDRFVVDRVAFVEGVEMPVSVLDGVGDGAVLGPSDVSHLIQSAEPGTEVLSMLVVDGERGLQDVEPSVIAPAQGDQPLWLVRALAPCTAGCERWRLDTYLVIDDSTSVFRLDGFGAADRIAGPDPDPGASWPPADAFAVVELTGRVGAGDAPAQVAVVDWSGRLLGVREVLPDDGPFPGETTDGGAELANVGPDVVRLLWRGTVCDRELVATIDEGVTAIHIDPGVRHVCDAMGVARELIFTFDGPVDTSSMAVILYE